MSQPALLLDRLGKAFRVPRASREGDPRREPLSRRRDLFHALRDVSFEVPSGETLGLIGGNGSGKSTLLKILSAVMAADSGSFEIRGRVGALLELGAGFHPDLSGIENVYLNGALLGLGAREIDRLLPEIIAFAELERFMDLPVRHFSSGMTARLGFAVATRMSPDILMMDETFAAGDVRFYAKALAHVAGMKKRGHTLLMVSHNMDAVLTLCDRAAWLDRGTLQRIGKPAEVVGEYQRSQRNGIGRAGHLRATLGMESLFDGPVAENSPLRIAGLRIGAANAPQAGDETGTVLLREGEEAFLDLRIERRGAAPRRFRIETAWVRAGGLIVAEGCTQAATGAEAVFEQRLTWKKWPLAAGEYRLAVALGDADAPGTYYDRRRDAATIRSIASGEPSELPVITRLACAWES